MEEDQGRIVGHERGGEVLVNEALENYKSIFSLLKSKRDTDVKIFYDNKVITRADLIELNQLVQNKLFDLTTQGNVVNITLSFSDSDVKTYGTWAAFEDQEWNHSCYTQSVVINWDFNVLLPNRSKQVPQPHSMRVRIGSGLRPNEFFHVVMTGGEDYEINEAMADVVFKIDFVNNILSGELKQIVSKWHEALAENKQLGILIRFSKRHRGKIELLINFLILASAVFVINVGVTTTLSYINLGSNESLLKWFYFFITGTFPLLYVVWNVSHFYSSRIISRTIMRYKKPPMIQITRGDLNKKNDVESTNNKLLNDLLMKVGVTLIVGVLAFFFGKVLPFIVKFGIGIYLGK